RERPGARGGKAAAPASKTAWRRPRAQARRSKRAPPPRGRATAIQTRLQAVSSWKVLLFAVAGVTGSRHIKCPRAATQLSPFTYNEGTIDTSKRFPLP